MKGVLQRLLPLVALDLCFHTVSLRMMRHTFGTV
jgi:hypothetical protein